ncbi:MAG: C4-type zinc finger protein DksA/TraR family [Labilithrix sp.]|nr:C4-type zinc finger protein DksA/TraR family [Labilithrix sp.]
MGVGECRNVVQALDIESKRSRVRRPMTTDDAMNNGDDDREVAELTPSQTAALQRKLTSARDEILARARTGKLQPMEASDVGDEMDQAASSAEVEQAHAYDERDRLMLNKIERALAKIERGEYGVSEESGEPIGYRRLDAVPWARLTIEEEEAAERRMRGTRR